MRNKYRFEFCV